jgi:hypothetical protein
VVVKAKVASARVRQFVDERKARAGLRSGFAAMVG